MVKDDIPPSTPIAHALFTVFVSQKEFICIECHI